MNVFSDRTLRIGRFMETEQIAAFHRFDRFIYIKEAYLRKISCQLDAAGSSGNIDQAGIFQLREYLADDDRIGIDARCQKVTSHLVFILKRIHAGKDMQSYRKSA